MHGAGSPHKGRAGGGLRGQVQFHLAKALSTEEKGRFTELLANTDVTRELAWLRTKFESFVAQLQENEQQGLLTLDQLEVLGRFGHQLASIAEKIRRAMDGTTINIKINPQDIEALWNVLKRYIPQDKWQQAARDLRGSIGGAASEEARTSSDD